MGRPSQISAVLAELRELAARFDAESAERRRLWEVCIEQPKRIGSAEADIVSLTIRLSRLEDDVRALKRHKKR